MRHDLEGLSLDVVSLDVVSLDNVGLVLLVESRAARGTVLGELRGFEDATTRPSCSGRSWRCGALGVVARLALWRAWRCGRVCSGLSVTLLLQRYGRSKVGFSKCNFLENGICARLIEILGWYPRNLSQPCFFTKGDSNYEKSNLHNVMSCFHPRMLGTPSV